MKTKYLLLILVLTASLYFLVKFLKNDQKTQNFQDTLVSIDTANVDRLLIKTSTSIVDLNKINEEWTLTLENGKHVPVLARNVLSTLYHLLDIKPSRIISKDPKKWRDYQVDDSLGTVIQVYANDKKQVDIILGTVGIAKNDKQATNPYEQLELNKQQQRFFSYVRIAGDDNVYASNDFLSFHVSKSPNDYRNSQLFNLTKDSLKNMTFIYPDNSSFSLLKTDSTWSIENQIANLDSIDKFINGIVNLTSQEFEDSWRPKKDQKPVYTIIANQTNNTSQEIQVFQQEGKLIFHSNNNPNNYFNDENGELQKKLIASKANFL